MGRRQADYVLKRQYSDISPTNTGFILTIIRHDRPGGPAVLLPLVALVIKTQLVSSGWSIHTEATVLGIVDSVRKRRFG